MITSVKSKHVCVHETGLNFSIGYGPYKLGFSIEGSMLRIMLIFRHYCIFKKKRNMNDPKQKAEDLVNRFMNVKSWKMSDYSKIYHPTAKACALIAVDELLIYANKHGFLSMKDFYESVKKEINNL